MLSQFRVKCRCLLARLFAWILRLFPRQAIAQHDGLLEDYMRIQDLRRIEEDRFRRFYLGGYIR